jgi:uncharacterized repeat protein (TIGR03806 family)
MRLSFFILIFLTWFFFGLTTRAPIETVRKEKLSEYNFFKGNVADLVPVEGVVAYEVNSSLFSNYAEKKRFIKIPEGLQATYNDTTAFDLPVGTILIKNFYFPLDFRKPDGPRQIIETRLLVHQPRGWEAWPYIWNTEQTEAVYDPAGEKREITVINKKGKSRKIIHAVPNKNQCKGCHVQKEVMVPIGITARQLNGDIMYKGSRKNQLSAWSEQHMISDVPELANVPKLAIWDDASSGSLNARARAYLDANCSHCHSKDGPANTSGLFLDIFENNNTQLGVLKTPVAAGRGASNLTFDIVPGKPDQSILIFRMKSTDPGIAMPEIGREQIHDEGVALIEEWIRKQTW